MKSSMTVLQALDIIKAWESKSAQRIHWFEEKEGGIFSRLIVGGENVADFPPTEHYPDGRIRAAQKIKREGEPGGQWSELNYSADVKAEEPDA